MLACPCYLFACLICSYTILEYNNMRGELVNSVFTDFVGFIRRFKIHCLSPLAHCSSSTMVDGSEVGS